MLISSVLTSAQGLMEEGSGWVLLIWSRIKMKNNMAWPRTHWADQARGLFCFSVLLSFSPPLGFMALELQGWKIIHPNHSSHNTLCKHLRLQTPLQQWEVINSSSSPTWPPVRQDTKHRAEGCATDTHCVAVTAMVYSPSKTCWPLCVTNPCPVPALEIRSSHHS